MTISICNQDFFAITNILPSSPPPLQHNNKWQQLERPTPGGKRTTTHRHQSQEEWWYHHPDQSKVSVSCVQCEPCSCFRYGETWAEQFRKINDYSGDGGEETLDLRATESITSIIYSMDDGGNTFSLQAETTTGSWGPVSDYWPDEYKSLRPSPRGKIKLAFISGREEYDNYCVRCQLPPIICYNLCLCCNRITNDYHRQTNQNSKSPPFSPNM